MNKFSSFKSPGVDGSFSEILQRVPKTSMKLCEFFRDYLASRYIQPSGWWLSMVAFITKEGQSNFTNTKSQDPLVFTHFPKNSRKAGG